MTDWEKVQSDQERHFGNQMGQGEAENLHTWSTQIQDHDTPQATSAFIQQPQLIEYAWVNRNLWWPTTATAK